MAVKELFIRIGADADQAKRELQSFNKGIDVVNRNLESVAGIATRSFIAFGGAIGVAVKQFAAFEKQFTNVVTLLDQGSFKTKSLEDGVNDLKKGLLDLRVASGESFENLNKGLFDLISAGIPAEKSIEALKVATDLAAAGATETSIAVDGLTSAVNAYADANLSAQTVADKFFTAQKFGKTTIQQLSEGFGLVGSSADAFGVSLDEVLASVSAVTLGGVRTNAAYTGLKSVFAGIANPTKVAADEAKRLGIEFNATALRSKGLGGFLSDLTKANGFTKDSVNKLFGSLEAQNFMFALTKNSGEKFNEILKEVSNEAKAAATFQDALAQANATTQKSLDRIGGAFESILVQIGEQFAPLLNTVADFITVLAQKFSNLSEGTKEIISGFLKWGGIISAIVAGGATFLLGITGLIRAFVLFNNVLGISKVLSLGYVAVLKIVDIAQKAFSATLKYGKLAAIGFWSAATLGATLLISFLPEIIAWFDKLNKKFGIIGKLWDVLKASFAIGINEIQILFKTVEIFFIKLQEVALGVAQKIVSFFEPLSKLPGLGFIEDVSKSLEEKVKQVKESSQDVIDEGKKLVEENQRIRNELSKPMEAAAVTKAEGEQVDVSALQEENALKDGLRAEDLQKEEQHQADMAKVRDKGTQDRINALKDEIAVLSAAREGMNKERQDFLRRELELERSFKDAKNIEDSEQRALELEKLRLQQKELQTTRNEYEAKRVEQEQLARELDIENKDGLTEEDKERLINQLQTEEDIKREFDLREAQADIDFRKKAATAENVFGLKSIAFDRMIGQAKLGIAAETAQNLLGSLATENEKAFRIQKKLNIAQAIMSAFTGANRALDLPFPVNLVTSALILAQGMANVSKIKEQQFTGAASGGILEGGVAGRDSIPLMGAPGEIVIPMPEARTFQANFPDFRNAFANASSERTGGGNITNINMTIEGNLIGEEENMNRLVEELDRRVRYDNARIGG